MDKFWYAYNTFVEYYWSFGMDFVPEMLRPILTACVFGICMFLVLILGKFPKKEMANFNNCGRKFKVFNPKFPTILMKVIGWAYILYMIPWVIYIVIAPFDLSSGDEMIRNIFWIVVMSAVAIVCLYFLFVPLLDSSLLKNSENMHKFFILFWCIAGAVLLCKMFSGIYFENCYCLSAFGVLIIYIFSWLNLFLNRAVEKRCYDTDRFYRSYKDEEETYVRESHKQTFKPIVNMIPFSDMIDSLRDDVSLNMAKNALFGEIKTTDYFTNEEYLANMNTAFQYIKSYKKNLYCTDGISGYCKGALEAEYSVDDYKPEAIEKVFEALEYNALPTKENYIEIRKTIELLNILYSKRLDELEEIYGSNAEEEYKTIESGVEGEKYVLTKLKEMKKRYPDMIVLKNFRFGYEEGTTAECDLLIITTGGIYCVEVKNYGQGGNYTLEISANGTWYKRYNNQVYQIDSDPFRQNHMHAEAIKRRFGSELSKLTADGSMPEIHELVVIANDINVYNGSPNKVLHVGGLCEYIVAETKQFDKCTVLEVAKNLSKQALPPIKYLRKDYESIAKEIMEVSKLKDSFEGLYNGIKLSEKYRIF